MIHIVKKPIVSPVFCDKLSATLKVNEEHHYDVLNGFEKIIDNGYGKREYKANYKKSLRLQLGDFDASTLIQCHPHIEATSFFRVEVNPNRIGIHGLADLKMHLDEILPDGYEGLVKTGICTRVDTTVDISNVEVNQLLYRYPGMQLSKAYYAKGKTTEYWNDIQSYYLGGDGGKGAQICIYDKIAETKKHNIKFPDNKVEVPKVPTVRIEVRHRNRRPLSRLYTLKNLFNKLDLYSFHKIPAHDWTFNLFVDFMQSQGAQNALLKLPDGTRKQYRKRLEVAKPNFWHPEEHWKDWKVVADRILHPPTSVLAPPLQSIAIV